MAGPNELKYAVVEMPGSKYRVMFVPTVALSAKTLQESVSIRIPKVHTATSKPIPVITLWVMNRSVTGLTFLSRAAAAAFVHLVQKRIAKAVAERDAATA